ncbi:MAG: hypothetical protein IJB79_03920 [Candidatus Gastranaerophilales bacterium]|nr:hypothetical protein [Candidatus Gastranaerophilales bacterium]
MKKNALTLAETIVALTMVAALSIIGLNTFRSNIPDGDLIRFKHTYGTVSTLISQMMENKDIYPDSRGFSNTDSVTIRKTGITYGGATKFQTAFKEKINILEDNVIINESNMPIYEEKVGSDIITRSANSLSCFTNNSGVTFCPPQTSSTSGRLRKIYLRVHVNDNFDISNAIYFVIHANGKIEFPTRIQNKFDCMLKEYDANRKKQNSYYQCSIISALDSL